MKIWIDALTPKQANFTAALVQELRKAGHEVIVTTRRYREVNQVLKLRGIRAIPIGRHGGPRIDQKLAASAERVAKLSSLVGRTRPSICLSFASPEAARVAFGLKIRHFCVCDSPHAEAVMRLALPLCSKLFAPKIIPKSAWTKYGISADRVITYDALDPIVWIRRLRANQGSRLAGIDRRKSIVCARLEESQAAYLEDSHGDLMLRVIDGLTRYEKVETVVLPRYREQEQVVRRRFGRKIVLYRSSMDGLGLLRASSVFIGAGGTMTTESALLGIPTISCYAGPKTYVEDYLLKSGLVKKSLNPEMVIRIARMMVRNPRIRAEQKERAAKITRRMEDPVRLILRNLR